MIDSFETLVMFIHGNDHLDQWRAGRVNDPLTGCSAGLWAQQWTKQRPRRTIAESTTHALEDHGVSLKKR